MPTRVDPAEKDKLERRTAYAKSRFDGFPAHMSDGEREKVLGPGLVPVHPVLRLRGNARRRRRPGRPNSLAAVIVRVPGVHARRPADRGGTVGRHTTTTPPRSLNGCQSPGPSRRRRPRPPRPYVPWAGTSSCAAKDPTTSSPPTRPTSCCSSACSNATRPKSLTTTAASAPWAIRQPSRTVQKTLAAGSMPPSACLSAKT